MAALHSRVAERISLSEMTFPPFMASSCRAKVGSPATDYSLDILHTGEFRDRDYMVRYKGTANGKSFISSSFFIKNAEDELIGMLCVNTDATAAQEFLCSMQRFMESVSFSALIDKSHLENPPRENLDTPIYTLANSIIAKTIEKYGVSPERMTREEKIQIVQELASQGIADLKGAISEIARQLSLSESTVYRYLSMKNP